VRVVLVMAHANSTTLNNFGDVFDNFALFNPRGTHLLRLEEEHFTCQGGDMRWVFVGPVSWTGASRRNICAILWRTQSCGLIA